MDRVAKTKRCLALLRAASSSANASIGRHVSPIIQTFAKPHLASTAARMKIPIEALRLIVTSNTTYAVRLARDAAEIRAAQALRFAIFNLELHEGLENSYATGLDADPFDAVCDHLLVEHLATGEIVGTYRLQTGTTAGGKLGYYSGQEFDFKPFEPMRAEVIELGRACVHKLHRNMSVLGLLWKGSASRPVA